MPPPLVSVVIPSYNRSRKLTAALASVARQSLQDHEVVVVDDASTDDTQAVMAGLVSDRVRYLRHDTNRGGNLARATGIAQARGRFVAFLDSDDRWHPEKLARQVSLLQERGPSYGLCTTWFSMISPDGVVQRRIEPTVSGLRCPELLVKNVLGGYSTAMVSREHLREVGGPDPSLPACQDWDLYLRLNQVTGVCVVPEHLVDYDFDVLDPVRISTRRHAVIAGHRHIYQLVSTRFDELDDAERVQSLLEFSEVFANAGAPRDVVAVVRDHPARLWTSPLRKHAAHMLVRAARKAATLGSRTRE
ncbi:MAG: glycosyltransferase family 2 protein [Austwickia sp.]|nr:glycosyltransferase family 2 protein [Austwickia sp.]MBK8437678.1 glycosyltransferase family 2 protein [Austwickia sp.]MBK9099989.1 glycosyltransferase family 2 protein [Austwickia sp.]